MTSLEVISAVGIDKALNMHCPGHNTVRGSQLASEGWYFGRAKNNKPYLEGQFVGGERLEIAANNKFDMFLNNTGPIFFQYS